MLCNSKELRRTAEQHKSKSKNKIMFYLPGSQVNTFYRLCNEYHAQCIAAQKPNSVPVGLTVNRVAHGLFNRYFTESKHVSVWNVLYLCMWLLKSDSGAVDQWSVPKQVSGCSRESVSICCLAVQNRGEAEMHCVLQGFELRLL